MMITIITSNKVTRKTEQNLKEPSLDPRSVLRTGLSGELHQLVAVLADEPFLVVASDVVPHLGTGRGNSEVIESNDGRQLILTAPSP